MTVTIDLNPDFEPSLCSEAGSLHRRGSYADAR